MEDEPPNQVRVTNLHSKKRVGIRSLQKAVRTTLEAHHARGSVNIAIVDDESMARLNARHLNHRGPTDVLTFDMANGRRRDDIVEGEIVVSLDTAMREAAARNHSVGAELMLYAVHGTLHLLGYDDRTRTQAARMHQMEDRILEQLGVGAVYSRDVSDVRRSTVPSRRAMRTAV